MLVSFSYDDRLISPSTGNFHADDDRHQTHRPTNMLTLLSHAVLRWLNTVGVFFLRLFEETLYDCLKGGQSFEVTRLHLYICWLAIRGCSMFRCTAEGFIEGPETPVQLWGEESIQSITVASNSSYISASSVLTGNFKQSNVPPAYIMGFLLSLRWLHYDSSRLWLQLSLCLCPSVLPASSLSCRSSLPFPGLFFFLSDSQPSVFTPHTAAASYLPITWCAEVLCSWLHCSLAALPAWLPPATFSPQSSWIGLFSSG